MASWRTRARSRSAWRIAGASNLGETTYEPSGAMIALPPFNTHCSGLFTRSGWGFQFGWQCARTHESACSEHIASALERVVPTSQLMDFLYCWPNRAMNVFASLMESLARQRHPVLPANQSPNSTNRSVDGAKS